jgi:glycosyltransferase involved in cell wall biosynthesis
MLRWAERLVDRVVTSSRSGFQVPTSKLRVIGQGIDVHRFAPAAQPGPPDAPFMLLTVGRISPVKHVELVIRAMGLLKERRPSLNARAVLVGGPLTAVDEAHQEALEALVRSLGVDEMVEFAGNRPFKDVHAYYQQAHCFINSSDTDSVDKTVLEAMSCEMPIVTSNVAFGEILPPALATECLIPKGDVEALYDRICRLIDMPPTERADLGRALRDVVVAHHSLPALARRIVQQFDELAAGATPGQA